MSDSKKEVKEIEDSIEKELIKQHLAQSIVVGKGKIPNPPKKGEGSK